MLKITLILLFIVFFFQTGWAQNQPTKISFGHLQTTLDNFSEIQKNPDRCFLNRLNKNRFPLNSCPKAVIDLVQSEKDTKFAVFQSKANLCQDQLDESKTDVNWSALHNPFESQNIWSRHFLWKSDAYSQQVVKSCSNISTPLSVMAQAKFHYYSDRLNLALAQISVERNFVAQLLSDKKNSQSCPTNQQLSLAIDLCQQSLKCQSSVSFEQKAQEGEQDEKQYDQILKQLNEVQRFCNYKSGQCLSASEKEARVKNLNLVKVGLELKNPWLLNDKFRLEKNKKIFSERYKEYLKKLEPALLEEEKSLSRAVNCIHGENYYLRECGEESLREVLSRTPTIASYPMSNSSLKESDAKYVSQMTSYQECVESDAIKKNQKAKLARDVSQGLLMALIPAGQGALASRMGLAAAERVLLMADPGVTAVGALFGSVNLLKETAPEILKKCMGSEAKLNKASSEVACQQAQQLQSVFSGSDLSQCILQMGLAGLSAVPILQMGSKVEHLTEVFNKPMRRAQDTENLFFSAARENRRTSSVGKSGSASDAAGSSSSLSQNSLQSVSQAGRVAAAVRMDAELSSKSVKSLDLVPDIPDSMRARQVTLVNGEERLEYKTAVQLKDQSWVAEVNTLPIDPVTGAINANFPSGKKFFEKLLQAKSSQSFFAFIDVGSLRVVNKTFQAGEAGGDRYLKAFSHVIVEMNKQRALQGLKPQLTLARLGGDEFGLLIDEANPQKAKKILEDIQKAFRDPQGEASQVFREEKLVRASQYRQALKDESSSQDALAAQKAISELAQTQRPDISVGASEVGEGQTLSNLLEVTEKQAQDMKIQSALNGARSAEKYGSKLAPRLQPNPRLTSQIADPISYTQLQKTGRLTSADVSNGRTTSIFKAPSVDTLPVLQSQQVSEVKRFGSMTLVQQQDQLGQVSYQVKEYYTDAQTGAKYLIQSEIPTRGATGLLDALHPMSQKLIMAHAHDVDSSLLVMPKLESLKYFNYFEDGTKAGDTMLEVVSDAIKKQMRSSDLTFKMPGNDFIWSLDHVPADQLKKITQKIQKQVLQDSRTVEILQKEKDILRKKLSAPALLQDPSELKKLQERLTQLEHFDLQLTFRTLSHRESQSAKSFKEITNLLEAKPPL